MNYKKLKYTIILIIIIVIIIAFRIFAYNSVNIKILDKITNEPIQETTVALSHEFFLEIDPNYTITKMFSDKNGQVSYSFLKTESLGHVIFFKDGYYPNRCDYDKYGNISTRCTDQIHLNQVNNPVKNMLYKRISVWDDISGKSSDLKKNRNLSLYRDGQNDISVEFSKSSSSDEFFSISKISFYGQGGAQLASNNSEFGLLNIMEAPLGGYSITISDNEINYDSQSYVFKTADGKHFGKFFLHSDNFYIFLNPNENDRNLEYELNKACMADILDDPYAFINLNASDCSIY